MKDSYNIEKGVVVVDLDQDPKTCNEDPFHLMSYSWKLTRINAYYGPNVLNSNNRDYLRSYYVYKDIHPCFDTTGFQINDMGTQQRLFQVPIKFWENQLFNFFNEGKKYYEIIAPDFNGAEMKIGD